MTIATTGRLSTILERLDGVRQNGAGWSARCPAHEDGTASLSVSEGSDGRTLLHCHAGCATPDVLKALGITMADLMPSDNHNGNGRERIVATYDYCTADGKLVNQAVRKIGADGKKTFSQRRPDGNGDWIWDMKGVKRVLYRLPELTAAGMASTVFIPEGEKDVDRLRSLGLVATCNVGGSAKGNWKPSYSDCLDGRTVVVLPDNDKAGQEHAGRVAASLQDKAESVKVVELPGLADKGDISDWLDNGGTLGELMKLVESAPEWKPAAKPGPKVTTPDPDAFRLTDTGLAERFADQHGANVRYCHPWSKWLVWDGKRWAPDDDGRLQQLAKQTARSILKEAAGETDKERFGDLLKFAASAESAHRRKAMLTLAQSEPPIPVLPNQLDQGPWLLNVDNGTIDLRTGKLRPHDQGDRMTKLCPTPYEPDAKAPRWESFLAEVLAGSNRLVQFIQRLAGYCLTGSVQDHVLPIFHGGGSNGKSTMLGALKGTLGSDYTVEAPHDLLMLSRGQQHPTQLATLFGKRLVVAMETEANRHMAESLVKQLTGGDTVACRRMKEDFWEFTPTHKIILACNHKPRIEGTDWAVWRRIKLVPFIITVGPDEQDKQLGEKLAAEAPGILAWAVRGCLNWQEDGLGKAEEIEQATAQYRSAEDTLAGFLAEVCIVENGATVRASDLLKAYKAWAADKNMTQRRFGEMLTERGFERFKSSSIWYRGMRLPPDGT